MSIKEEFETEELRRISVCLKASIGQPKPDASFTGGAQFGFQKAIELLRDGPDSLRYPDLFADWLEGKLQEGGE